MIVSLLDEKVELNQMELEKPVIADFLQMEPLVMLKINILYIKKVTHSVCMTIICLL